MQYSLEQTSPRRTALTLLNIYQANGIDSPGCARPEKRIDDEATTRRIECDRNTFDRIRPPEVHLVLQTMRSHDQSNTAPYVPDGRYRGFHNGRWDVLVNPADIEELGLHVEGRLRPARTGGQTGGAQWLM